MFVLYFTIFSHQGTLSHRAVINFEGTGTVYYQSIILSVTRVLLVTNVMNVTTGYCAIIRYCQLLWY